MKNLLTRFNPWYWIKWVYHDWQRYRFRQETTPVNWAWKRLPGLTDHSQCPKMLETLERVESDRPSPHAAEFIAFLTNDCLGQSAFHRAVQMGQAPVMCWDIQKKSWYGSDGSVVKQDTNQEFFNTTMGIPWESSDLFERIPDGCGDEHDVWDAWKCVTCRAVCFAKKTTGNLLFVPTVKETENKHKKELRELTGGVFFVMANQQDQAKFTPGKYSTRSIWDSDCIFEYEITRVSEKSVWVKSSMNPTETRRGVKV